MSKLDCFIVKRPLTKPNRCGDTGIVKEFDGKVFLAIVDVLGRDSREGHKLAKKIEAYLEEHYSKPLLKIMIGLDKHIHKSKGAVAAMCLVNLKTGNLKCVGIGNAVVRKFGSNNLRLVYRSGVIGYMMPNPKEEVIKLHDGDVLLLHTDGIREHFELDEYPELLTDNAKIISTHIIRQFGKGDDDAACIVFRYCKL